jgi:gas vesicle protein
VFLLSFSSLIYDLYSKNPNQKSWTVQVKDAEIYYKLKVEDVIEKQGEFVKEATKDLEDKYLNEIKDLKEELKKSKKETRDLKVMYNNLVDKYDAIKKGTTKK